MSCQETTPESYIQAGHYGMVYTVHGFSSCNNEDYKQDGIKEMGKLFGALIPGFSIPKHIRRHAGAFAHKVLVHHDLGSYEVATISRHGTNGPESITKPALGYYFEEVASTYNDKRSNQLRLLLAGAEKPPHYLGKVLSDILELLPLNISARLLAAAADPDLTRNILRVPRNDGLSRTDNQQNAVEATVMMPLDLRHRIFEEIAKIYPGNMGAARRLHGLISSHWSDRNSEYCGTNAVYRNLSGEEAGEKVVEVLQDLTPLREIMEATA